MRSLSVLNAGSSSLKFCVYRIDGATPSPTLRGAVEQIGHAPVLRLGHDSRKVAAPDMAAALDLLATLPDGPLTAPGLCGIGHRVVHGGPDLTAPLVIDDASLARIDAVSPLAPMHNPPALEMLRRIRARLPGVPQVACFDTSFHHGHSDIADRFAIPDALYQQGARRYGFHGLSYEYIAGALAGIDPALASGRVVVAHLGSGASMCALHAGRSVDSTMGFTPLDGLPMATRPGALDAGLVLWLQQEKGWDGKRLEQFLYHECGLRGLSGLSGDIRELLASNAPLPRLAVSYFVHHIARNAAALACSLGGLDGMVFTAGIGEHAGEIRARVLTRLAWLGFRLDEVANGTGGPLLTSKGAGLPAWVIPTDEEVVIARHTLALVG
jgi:acetate kinase